MKLLAVVSQKGRIVAVTERPGRRCRRHTVFQQAVRGVHLFHADIFHDADVHGLGKEMAQVRPRDEQLLRERADADRLMKSGGDRFERLFYERGDLPRGDLVGGRAGQKYHHFGQEREEELSERLPPKHIDILVKLDKEGVNVVAEADLTAFRGTERGRKEVFRKLDEKALVVFCRGRDDVIDPGRDQKERTVAVLVSGVPAEKGALPPDDEEDLVICVLMIEKVCGIRPPGDHMMKIGIFVEPIQIEHILMIAYLSTKCNMISVNCA